MTRRPPVPVKTTGRTNGVTPSLVKEATSPLFKGGVLYVEGAAVFLNTTQRAIREKVARRTVPFHKLEGRIVFFRDELSQFLDALPGCSVKEACANLARKSGEEAP